MNRNQLITVPAVVAQPGRESETSVSVASVAVSPDLLDQAVESKHQCKQITRLQSYYELTKRAGRSRGWV